MVKLTKEPGKVVNVPLIKESPVNIECKLKDIISLGSHDMFVADVAGVNVEGKFMNKNNKFELDKADPIVYSHGEYYSLGERLGSFGYSVKKKK